MSFFAVTLTGSFKERNESECLINRLLSLVKPPAFNQHNLFATTQWILGQKKLICRAGWLAGWTSFNLGKCFPDHHPPHSHNTTPGQRTEFLVPYSIWNSRSQVPWSVCLSVRPSVCPPLFQHSVNAYHSIGVDTFISLSLHFSAVNLQLPPIHLQHRLS